MGFVTASSLLVLFVLCAVAAVARGERRAFAAVFDQGELSRLRKHDAANDKQETRNKERAQAGRLEDALEKKRKASMQLPLRS